MERSVSQIRYDIDNRKGNFKKCYESAPIGYKFLCNHNKDNDNEWLKNTQWYINQGFLVLPIAYNMYDEEMPKNYVSIYERIK